MVRLIALLTAFFAILLAAQAGAAVPQVFTLAEAGRVVTPVGCQVQTGAGVAGQRWCGGVIGTRVASFDGFPVDVSVALPPAPASGPDGGFPVVGLYTGFPGQKLFPSGDPASEHQRWLSRGYAVFSLTPRGLWGSCGKLPASTLAQPSDACGSAGYVHFDDQRYEVRDAQYLLGLLADQGVIDPQRIGASGPSYGGGMSIQLGALRNRVVLPDGTLAPWTSPVRGLAMAIAAAVPRATWSDALAFLVPNGSALDYAALNPYAGPRGDRRFGLSKQGALNEVYDDAPQTGFWAATGADPTADWTAWKAFLDGGGPYDGKPPAVQIAAQLRLRSAYDVDDSVAPAPMLLANGWNDDGFGVDDMVRYANKVRHDHPEAPVALWGADIGHTRVSYDPTGALDAALAAAQVAWMDFYVRGAGSEPAGAHGGVDVIPTACSSASSDAAAAVGPVTHATSWIGLAHGEVRLADGRPRTIAPGTRSAASYEMAKTTVCNTGPSRDTAGAVVDAVPAAGSAWTLAGSPTVSLRTTTAGPGDQLVARLLDVSGHTERLIARGVLRPTGVGKGPTEQVFQLHAQMWQVVPGHVIKLELLSSDAPYMRDAAGQRPVGVRDLRLTLPALEGAGGAGGLVEARTRGPLPPGYAYVPEAAALPAAPASDATDRAIVAIALAAPVTGVSAKGAALRFSDAAPEPGTATYVLSRGGRRLGRAVVRVDAAGPVKVSVTTAGRAPRGALKLRTIFVSAVEHAKVTTTRKLGTS